MPKYARAYIPQSLTLRKLQVVRSEDLSPALRRVVLTGDQLRAFTNADGSALPAFDSRGFDDDVRLYFPYPGETEPVLPVQKQGTVTIPKDPRPIAKEYTVRWFDAEKNELALDFVKHGVGVATTWAYRAQPGDRAFVLGPPVSSELPVTDWMLVAGDDTAIPAIARLLDELPEDAKAQVFIEVASISHRIPLRELPGVTVTWLPRGGQPAGSTTLLLDAVMHAQWWPGEAFAWVAGESSAVKHIRRHLVGDRGLAKERVQFTGYWKRSDVIALDEDPAIPDPEKNPDAFEAFHELAEIGPAYALRAAADLNLGELIFHGSTDITELAKATGANERALGKLLRYLRSIDIVLETSPGRFALTETGEFLTNEFVLDVLRSDGVTGRKERAFLGLTDAVRTGTASYEQVTGKSYAEVRAEQHVEDQVQEQAERLARLRAASLRDANALDGVEHLVLHSDGAATIADTLTAGREELRVSIVALPAQADFLRRELASLNLPAAQNERISVLPQSPFERAPEADAVLLVHRLTEHPDADAAHLLRQVAARLTQCGRVLLLASTFDTEGELDEHAAEADVLNLALYGSGYRTRQELEAVIDAAGLTVAATEPFVFGDTLYSLSIPNTESAK